MAYKKVILGSLYLDGMAQPNPQNPIQGGDIPSYDGASSVTIGDTVTGKGITWIRPEGMKVLVADRVLMTNVSYHDLDQFQFTEGTVVSIDRIRYRCRIMKEMQQEGKGEWDDYLARTNNLTSLWNWRTIGTICGETRAVASKGIQPAQASSSSAIVRGGKSSKLFGRVEACKRSNEMGFRPILIPVENNLPHYGKRVTLDGQQFLVGQDMIHTSRDKIAIEEGFRPILFPEVGQPSPFIGIPDKTVVTMYTLLMGGKPVRQDRKDPVRYKTAQKLTITDEFYGFEYLIQWVIKQGYPHALNDILKDISVSALCEQGFYFM